MRNAWINIGDDCFSPKPNTSNILVTNIYCNGTHGISMGSIGQYAGVKDIIENAWIENVTMLNAQVSPLFFAFPPFPLFLIPFPSLYPSFSSNQGLYRDLDIAINNVKQS